MISFKCDSLLEHHLFRISHLLVLLEKVLLFFLLLSKDKLDCFLALTVESLTTFVDIRRFVFVWCDHDLLLQIDRFKDVLDITKQAIIVTVSCVDSLLDFINFVQNFVPISLLTGYALK